MTDTTTNDVDLIPAFRVDRSLVDEMDAATTELRAAIRAMVPALRRAKEVNERFEAALDLWPLGRMDDISLHIPCITALADAMSTVGDLSFAAEHTSATLEDVTA